MIVRTLLLILIGAVGFESAFGAERFIQFNGYRAHPTRVIVKYAKRRGEAQGIHGLAMGYAVARQYTGVQGLSVLNIENMPSPNGDQGVEGLRARIRNLIASGEFEYVEPDYLLTPDALPSDSRFVDGTLWGLNNRGQNGG